VSSHPITDPWLFSLPLSMTRISHSILPLQISYTWLMIWISYFPRKLEQSDKELLQVPIFWSTHSCACMSCLISCYKVWTLQPVFVF
jgi:hypothetical protein